MVSVLYLENINIINRTLLMLTYYLLKRTSSKKIFYIYNKKRLCKRGIK
jgi:hypothetical protein